jgi:lipopolysaccharide transport protein LptA
LPAISQNQNGVTEFKKETPARIKSDIIDIKRKSQVINFYNNVVVEKDDSSLIADHMKLIYLEKENSSDDVEIKKIEAFNNVKIFTSEYVASGNYGYYLPKKNLFILEEDVIVNNGTSIASGEKFIYDIKIKLGNFVGAIGEASIGKKRNAKNIEDTKKQSKKRITIIIGDEAQKEFDK